MNLFIFNRHYNDVDHIVPIIYYICIKNKDVTATLINASDATDFSEDYRILFLKKELGIKYYNMADFSLKYRIPYRTSLKIQSLFKKLR